MAGFSFGLLKKSISKTVGRIVLQILRIFTLLTLGGAIVSCWVLIIKVNQDRSFWFFDATSLFFTSTISCFLAISELQVLSFMRRYFSNTWPVLSEKHGLSWLGISMFVIGCNLLGKLNQPANDSDKIGLPWWRLVLASGILVITFGVINVISSFCWRDGKISARAIRRKGRAATADGDTLPTSFYDKASNSSIRNEKARSKIMSMFWKKDDGGEKYTHPPPIISAPMPVHQNQTHDDDVLEDRRSPIAPGYTRPPSAMHPMNTGRSSQYSVANMSRWGGS